MAWSVPYELFLSLRYLRASGGIVGLGHHGDLDGRGGGRGDGPDRGDGRDERLRVHLRSKILGTNAHIWVMRGTGSGESRSRPRRWRRSDRFRGSRRRRRSPITRCCSPRRADRGQRAARDRPGLGAGGDRVSEDHQDDLHRSGGSPAQSAPGLSAGRDSARVAPGGDARGRGGQRRGRTPPPGGRSFPAGGGAAYAALYRGGRLPSRLCRIRLQTCHDRHPVCAGAVSDGVGRLGNRGARHRHLPGGRRRRRDPGAVAVPLLHPDLDGANSETSSRRCGSSGSSCSSS